MLLEVALKQKMKDQIKEMNPQDVVGYEKLINFTKKIAPLRRPSRRAAAFPESWTSTPHPSREVSSGRVNPTSLKLMMIIMKISPFETKINAFETKV